jgi:hypothetical protein
LQSSVNLSVPVKKQIYPASLRIFALIGLFCLCHPFIGSAQNPGGVANATLWLYGSQANPGSSGSTTNNWNDLSASGNYAYGTTGSEPVYYDNTSNDFNYNPVVAFNGNDVMNLESNSGLTSGGTARTVFIVAKPNTVAGTQYLYSYGSNTNNQGFSVLASGALAAMNTGTTTYTSGSNFWSTTQPSIMTSTYGGGNNSPLGGLGNGLLNLGSTLLSLNTNVAYYQIYWLFGFIPIPIDYGSIGAPAWNNNTNEFNGNIAEIIQFSSALNAANQLQVTSYLAVKYGITQDQTSATNYVNSAGTVTWNATTLAKYTNNLAALGKDKNTSLNQTVSRSVNSGFQITVSMGSAITDPVSSNTATIATDKSFFMWGDNKGSTSFTRTATFGASSYNAMVRNWQIQKPSWTDANVTIAQDSGTTATYLLVASDSAFTHVVSATALNTSNGNITLNTSNIPNGDYITFARIIPLPVNLIAFTGITTNQGNQLTWVTAGEENNKYFDIQRSTDGQNFEDIGQVPGMGTTVLSQTYTFTDPNPVQGKVNDYRLHQVDDNGYATNSWIISLTMGEATAAYLIYPNPVPSTLNLTVPPNLNQLTTEIYTTDGKLMYRQVLSHPGTSQAIDVSRFVSGMYFLHLVAGDGSQKTLSFLKQ